MIESSEDKRVVFQRVGQQQKWLNTIIGRTSVRELAEVCCCSERTIRDWKREKFYIRYDSFLRICTRYKVPAPRVRIESRFIHTRAAGRKGGAMTLKKYGKVPVSESVRKAGWQKWWDEEGRHINSSITRPRVVRLPKRSAKLAEFFGLMLGDGTIAQYHIAVTLHAVDDLEYSHFVTRLVHELFEVEPKTYYRKDATVLNVVVARKKLVEYLSANGLVKGDKIKQRISIPGWILRDREYARACLRGLMDTDGSVFTHQYTSKGVRYAYTKISFTSASQPLLRDVIGILHANEIVAQCFGRNICISSQKNVVKFFQLIGSSNPKHLKRMRK